MTMKTLINFISAIALGMSVVWLTGCPTSSDPPADDGGGGGIVLDDPNPPLTVVGTTLYCDHAIQTSDSTLDDVVAAPDGPRAPPVAGEDDAVLARSLCDQHPEGAGHLLHVASE